MLAKSTLVQGRIYKIYKNGIGKGNISVLIKQFTDMNDMNMNDMNEE